MLSTRTDKPYAANIDISLPNWMSCRTRISNPVMVISTNKLRMLKRKLELPCQGSSESDIECNRVTRKADLGPQMARTTALIANTIRTGNFASLGDQ